ncbi:MAG: amidohydrolase, partial [Cyclobacteriaceae bacterium]|nr:amidohydrolase [Cyclobacteriaceae bacterium]
MLLLICSSLHAQVTYPVNGIPSEPKNHTAYIHANIQINYNTTIQNGVLLIRENKIIAAGADVPIPKDAVIIDLKGAWIYPSFIECFSNYGIKYPEKKSESGKGPQFLSEKPGAYHWNEAVHPETHASDYFTTDEKKAETLRSMGFGLSLSQIQDGIMRGTSTLVMCGNERENNMILKPQVSQAWSFLKGSSTQDYPSSLMGSIALIRQTLYDAQWYRQGGFKEETNLSLQALNESLILPIIFEGTDEQDVLRAKKIADEFKLNMIIKGNGAEYQIARDLQAAQAVVIIPVNFPPPYDVSNGVAAEYIPLVNLKHWELAPFNGR